MRSLNFSHLRRPVLLLVLSLACVSLAFAGGYWIELENPAASGDPKARDAVLIVRATLCHNTPAEALLTATAEGFVGGRTSIAALGPPAPFNARSIRHSAAVADGWRMGGEHRRCIARGRPTLPDDRRRFGSDRTGLVPGRHREN